MIKKIKKILYQYRAVFFIISLTSASIIGIIHLFNISSAHNVELITRSAIKSAKKTFTDLESNTGDLLSSTLEALLVNKEIAKVYLSGDRESLFRLVRPVFERIKKQNNITHWYFLKPEPAKTCFLRVHSPHIYNDKINLLTLDTCIKTKKPALGKELGKTALALRAVHPYYYNGQLIGYMELAVEMENFFQALKRQTANEYGLLIKKEFLDREKWASVTSEKNIRNNWDDMAHFLMVDSTRNCARWGQFQQILENLETIPDEGLVLEKITKDRTQFVRGIFPFYDAANRKVGGVFILKDVTTMLSTMEEQKEKIVLMILVFMGLITFFMIFFHKRAEKELRMYRNRLEDLVREATAELREANRKLNLEIEEHKAVQVALEEECKAREEAEQKQINAVKHAEQAARMASIGVMAAGITHEINQPLNAIKVSADSIQYWYQRNPGTLPKTFSDQLNIISRSVKRIVEIIQHMRAFWVVPQPPGVSQVNVNKAVKNALSLIRQQLHAHGIREEVKIVVNPLNVKGNLVHFEQIIINLVVNAIHALDQREQKDKKIEITTFPEGNFARLIIEDNGPGLPSENIDKLFDPFFSTNHSGEGMGLGLAIVKRYIDRYKGKIHAVNKDGPGTGARFTLTFPLYGADR